MNRQLRWNEYLFSGRRDPAARSDRDDVGRLPVCGDDTYKKAAQNSEARSTAKVGLPLQKVILLAFEITRGKEAAIKPKR